MYQYIMAGVAARNDDSGWLRHPPTHQSEYLDPKNVCGGMANVYDMILI